ncbi:hypothetical protein ABTE84_19805, partial [Acinetobacter baumannii]
MSASSLMSMVRAYWRVGYDQPELLIAQYRAFSGKMPMMYLILLINSWALAQTYYPLAPHWLSL